MCLNCNPSQGEITIIEFREIRLEDKPIIDDYFHQKRYEQAISYSKKDSISITNINGIPLSHIDKDEFEVYIEKV